MSGPATALPPEIHELMTVPVTWEKWTGFDGYGQPSYAAPVTLYCWLEKAGMITGGYEAVRKPDGTSVDAEWDLFFDGSDSRVQGFALWDRFTVPSVGGESRSLQALFLSTNYGPPFDNQAPWLVQVTL